MTLGNSWVDGWADSISSLFAHPVMKMSCWKPNPSREGVDE